ncbi:acyltransferase family protein [Pseudonocardia abyssalis]|uniref:Acyltransferase n=1 Tax=Pseudonocardia abyssalis TaxID=2792008 RepID=A0ABS6UNM8_9PSEU|nr:acyltransferase [Pseudonocardia abyssalis]MBW0116286.1 acyltransferase [Pseudonocardia abyssalis]MBW0133839.1 acyltransferase [Pseudonocardia abyssalis]
MLHHDTRPHATHLDALRTVLVAWVIAGHALMGYSAVGGWAYDEVHEVTFTPAAELVLVALLGPTGLFVIGVFFFVSGLLTESALARHGAGAYVRSRMLRLGLPWAASALLVWPASVWLAYTAAGRDVSFLWVLTHRQPLLDSGSLWFALVLLVYSVAFAAWYRLSGPPAAAPRPLTAAHLGGAAVAVALVSFVVRLVFSARSGQVGDLHLWQWPQCAGMFVLGVAAARRGWVAQVPDRIRRGCGVAVLAVLVLLPVAALASGVRDVARDAGPYLGGWNAAALATAAAEAVLVVAGSVWLVGLAGHHGLGAGPRATALARAAFPAFVVQGPVLIGLAVLLRPLDLPAEVKAPLVAAAALWVCFGLGRVVSRRRDRARPPAQRPVPGA